MAEMTFPWEQEPTPLENIVAAMQRDLAYMVTHTAVLVHSKHAALAMLVNTPRGQRVPKGECKLSDGSTFEFQDVGMPQVNAPEMSVPDLLKRVYEVTQELGLKLL